MEWQIVWFAGWLGVAVLTAVAGAEEASHVADEGRSVTATPLAADDGIPVVAAKDVEITPNAAPAEATLQRVEFLNDPPRLRIELSKPVSPIAGTRPAEAGKPPRVALNLPRASVGAVPAVVAASGPVLRVRTKQIRPGVVQVVADLRQPMTYSVERSGTTITVALAAKPEAHTPPAPPAKPTPVATAAAQAGGKTATPAAVAKPAPRATEYPASLDALAASLKEKLAAAAKPPAAPASAPDAKAREIARIAAETLALETAPPAAQVAAAAPEEATAPPPAAEAMPPARAEATTAPQPAIKLQSTPLPPTPPAPRASAPLRPADRPIAAPVSTEQVALSSVAGIPYIWPSLEEPYYGDAEAAPLRAEIARRRAGETPPNPPLNVSHVPSTFYLTADATFLRAVAGQEEMLTAAQSFERALRQWQDFPDAARALFVLGQIDLSLGLAPEAGIAFAELARRFPSSPLLLDGRIGLASSLRLRRRTNEARALVDDVLARASGEVACRARREQAALAATPAAAVEALRRMAEACPKALDDPRVLRSYAEALVAAGEREAARQLLARRASTTGWIGDEGARLYLLAGVLASDLDGARSAYEHVLGMRVSPEVVLEAEMRLALLDRSSNPERAAARLAELVERPGPVALRAAVLGEAAEAKARTGRFEEALALLERGPTLGPEGAAQAEGRRSEILGHWITSLTDKGDDAGVATVYAAYSTAVSGAASNDRVAVARALSRLGLHASAARLLAANAGGPADPELLIEALEETVASGDGAETRAALTRVKAMPLAPVLASRVHAAAARAALLDGEVDTAAAEAAETSDLAARAEVARVVMARPGGSALASTLLKPALAGGTQAPYDALMVAGDASVAEGAFDTAENAYKRALEQATTATERAAATSGLARAARAGGDHATAAGVLSELAHAGADDPLIRRLATAAAQAGVRDVP